jgi:peptide/nickel transport system substrate-binding protein
MKRIKPLHIARVAGLSVALLSAGITGALAGPAVTGSAYVIAIPQDFQGVDRSTYSSEAAKVIADVMQGRVLELETDGSQPTACQAQVPPPLKKQSALVESWSVNPEGMGIDVTLRSGVRSAAGHTLSSEDVNWTLQRAIAIDASARVVMFKVGFFDINNPITVKSPTQFRLNLTKPNSLSPYVLASVFGLVIDSQDAKAHSTQSDPWAKGYLTDHTANFGPWNLTQFSSQQLSFAPNPNFTSPRGNIEQMVIRTVANASSRVQLLQVGDIAEATGLDYSQMERLKTAPTIHLTQCANPARDWLGLNASDTIVGQRAVRQAISMTLDRASMVKAVYRGFAEPASNGLSSQFMGQAKSPYYRTDIERAKALLASVGLEKGFDLNLKISLAQPGPYSANLAAIIQQQLAQINIRVSITNVPSAVQFRAEGIAHTMQAWLGGETPAFSNPGFSAWLTNGSNGLQNYAGFSNAALDRTADALMTNNQNSDAAATQQQLAATIAEQQPAVYLVDRYSISVRNECANSVPASSFVTDYTQAVTTCR